MQLHILPLKEALETFEGARKDLPDVANLPVGVYIVEGKEEKNQNLILCLAPLPLEVEIMLAAIEQGAKPLIDAIDGPEKGGKKEKTEKGKDVAGPQFPLDLSKLGSGLS